MAPVFEKYGSSPVGNGDFATIGCVASSLPSHLKAAPIYPSYDSTPEISRPGSPWPPMDEGEDIFEKTLMEKVRSRIASRDPFFSLEFFPPKTRSGAVNLLARLERMGEGGPLMVDITWHMAGNPAGESETSSTMIAHSCVRYVGLETMLHMTCLGCREQTMRDYLQKAKIFGIRNILALRGDNPNEKFDETEKEGRMQYATDMVRYIAREFPGEFTVVVAGYPSGHPDAASYEEDLLNLKAKVDAGADFIITQLFFKASTFKKFYDDCRAVGITCPIIPGVMPIQSFDSLRHIVNLSKLEVPDEIQKVVLPLKGNDDAIRNFGVHQATQMMKELLSSGYACGVHIYTLNREVAATSILKRLGLWKNELAKPLPFKTVADPKRSKEEVRPIFWSQRSRTYIFRTRHWDEFPNGRWGNSASPAFGDLKDYYLFYLASKTPKADRLKMWGEEITKEEDVWQVFSNYMTGETNDAGHKVTRTPFNDDTLDKESCMIADNLAAVNKKGVLTINSQPSVNSAPSSDPIVGWGPPGGYVFQRAYLEFFTCKKNVISLIQIAHRYPSVNFQIINHDSSFDCTNVEKLKPIAVTWGVFPGCEIKQPTIVDPVSFKAWSEEAFGLWREEWGKLYDEGSKSREVIEHIVENYYLVNLVDNDFPMGSCLWNMLDDMFSRRQLNERIAQTFDPYQVIKEMGYHNFADKI